MRVVVLLLMVLAASWPLAARAQAADEPAKLFAQAIALFEKRSFDEALPLFEQTLKATGSPNARLYVARCLAELGRLAEAHQQMKATVAAASALADSQPKYVPTRDSAAAELAILDQRVGKLVVAIADPPAEVNVWVNGQPLPRDQLGKPYAVEPGGVDIVVKAPRKQTEKRRLEIEAGQVQTLALSLRDKPFDAPSSPAVDPPLEPDEASGGIGSVRIAGIVVTGVGLVGVGVFAGLAAKAKSEFDAIDAACGQRPCPATFAQRIDDGRTLQTAGNIALLVGGVMTLAGTAMIIFGGPDEPDESALRLDAASLDGGGMLTVGGSF